MQIAGQTLSVAAASKRSSKLLKPSSSQSTMSFAALFERAIIDTFSSSLRASELFGRSIARRRRCRDTHSETSRIVDAKKCQSGTLDRAANPLVEPSDHLFAST